MKIAYYGVRYADGRVALGQRLLNDTGEIGGVTIPEGAQEISHAEALAARAEQEDDASAEKAAPKRAKKG